MLRCIALLAMAVAAGPAAAQVVADPTLGTTVTGSSTLRIGGGTLRGGNLFHSFQRFGVGASQTALFQGPGAVQNIVARVTGGAPSSIHGTLSSDIAGANLYLVNPAGVSFGPTARLDVSGSVHVSSAHYVEVGGARFYADAGSASSLTSAHIGAFGFLGPAAALGVDGATLRVAAGKSLSLSGGSVEVTDATLRARGGGISLLAASGGITLDASEILSINTGDARGEAVSLAAAGELAVTDTKVRTSARGSGDAGGIQVRADTVRLAQHGSLSSITRNAGDAGNLSIAARTLTLDSSGNLESAVYSGTGNAGRIVVNAAEAVTVRGGTASASSGIFADSFGRGAAGLIRINAPLVQVSELGRVEASTIGAGAAGRIRLVAGRVELAAGGVILAETLGGRGEDGRILVQASESIAVHGSGTQNLATTASIRGNTTGAGDAARIVLEAPLVSLDNHGLVQSATAGAGNAGTIRVRAGRLELLSTAQLYAGAQRGGGAGGSIAVDAGAVLIDGDDGTAYSAISVNTRGERSGGSVRVSARDLTLSNSGTIEAYTFAAGDAGSVRVSADRIRVLDAGSIEATARAGSLGNGGSVRVAATESIVVDGAGGAPFIGGIMARTDGSGRAGQVDVAAPLVSVGNGGIIGSLTTGTGDAGSVSVSGRRVEVLSGGRIDSGTFGSRAGSGAGGAVTVTASEAVRVEGALPAAGLLFPSSIASDTGGARDAGDVRVSAPLMRIADGGEVSVSSAGAGRAGSILLEARELTLENGGFLRARTVSADAGDIVVRAVDLVHLRNSEISTSVAGGRGGGGNILIDPVFVVLDDSRIIANAFRGAGGNIQIVSDFFLSNGGVVSASSEQGISGTVAISSPRVDLGSSLRVLPSNFLDAATLLRASCGARAAASNSFVAAGRGGLATHPGRQITWKSATETLSGLPVSSATFTCAAAPVPSGS